MFGFFSSLKKTCHDLVARITENKNSLHDHESIKKLFLEADVGPAIANTIISFLHKQDQKIFSDPQHTQKVLHDYLVNLLGAAPTAPLKPIILLVGINGSGKTSAAAKLAHTLTANSKKVLLVAADTFRAAGAAQLVTLAHAHNLPIISGTSGQDPATVVYQACDQYVTKQYDYMIIDTAGRLHNNEQLLAELAKIKHIINKKRGEESTSTLLVVDTMLGQSSLAQATLFHKTLTIDGILMTKTDGAARGGIMFAIARGLNLPIRYVTYGESIDAIAPFDAQKFVTSLLTPSIDKERA